MLNAFLVGLACAFEDARRDAPLRPSINRAMTRQVDCSGFRPLADADQAQTASVTYWREWIASSSETVERIASRAVTNSQARGAGQQAPCPSTAV